VAIHESRRRDGRAKRADQLPAGNHRFQLEVRLNVQLDSPGLRGIRAGSLTKHLLPYKIQPVVNIAPPPGAHFLPNLAGTQSKKMANKTSTHEAEQPQTLNLAHVNAESIAADQIKLRQSAVREVNAEEVFLDQSAAINVQAASLTMHESALGLVQADNVDMQNGTAAGIRATDVFLNGRAGAVVAGKVEFGHARVGVLASREVRGEKIESVILLSRNVQGDVTTIMDTRGALISGMLGGLIAGTMLLLGRMVFGRK